MLGHPVHLMSLSQQAADTAGAQGFSALHNWATVGMSQKSDATVLSLGMRGAEGQVFQQHYQTPAALSTEEYVTKLQPGMASQHLSDAIWKNWVRIRARKLIWQIEVSTCQSCGSVFPTAITHPTRGASITWSFCAPSRTGWLNLDSCSAEKPAPWHN